MRSTAWRRIVRFERPRKSNLSRPSASMPCISYWVIGASEFVAFWSGMSSVSGSRLMTTPAACVEALRATPSSCFAKSMIRWTVGSRVVHLPELGARSRAPRRAGSRAGSGRPWRSGRPRRRSWPEHPADVADRRPGEHRAEGDDLGDVVRAVLAADVGDDLVAPAVLEVDVDVGHRHPVGVEEALERAAGSGSGRPA